VLRWDRGVGVVFFTHGLIDCNGDTEVREGEEVVA
jgi:hypothetical protein